MNYIWIAGNLGADPETRFTPSGKKVTSLRVACKSRKNGADETMWMKVTIWGETFDKILPYFKKGSSIVVCGELMIPDIYQNRDGVTQVSMSITAHHISFSPFGKGKSSEESANSAVQSGGFGSQPAQSFASNASPSEIPDEGIPF